jgi:hypothetical protein
MIELPMKKVSASRVNPRKLIIFSKPKVGKTSAIAELENTLILDFEQGSDYVDAVKVNIDSLATLREIGTEILKQNKPYKRIAVDTVTRLEDMCIGLAEKLYKQTPIGKNFGKFPNGQEDPNAHILHLPNGAGYQYLRQAVESVYKYIETLADEIIYIGHIKTRFLEKNGKEVAAAELDLTGKIKSMLSADADAIGLLYREGNKCILSFKTTDDVICGARPEHLKNKEIVLSEVTEDGKFIVNWDKIYLK